VDEVDSVLIDEARTPLIISGPVGNESDAEYAQHNAAVSRLVRRQSDLVNSLVAAGEKAFEAEDNDQAALNLYKAQLGGPKNKRLLKVFQETGAKQLVQKMELQHIADRRLPAGKQQYRDIEDDLLYVLDEKGHTVHLTDAGVDFMSPEAHDEFVLPDLSQEVHAIDHDPDLSPAEKLAARDKLNREYAAKSERLNIVHQLLRAHALFERDVNYVVQEGQVLIVDEFTGRTMHGRRWSEGLHQAVEAKEGVQVKGETQTLATITIQNYFRLYEKLAGMTGTAETEETEFHEIYKLGVSVIPTNRPVVRDDRQDLVYKTRREKYNAILEETERLHELGEDGSFESIVLDTPPARNALDFLAAPERMARFIEGRALRLLLRPGGGSTGLGWRALHAGSALVLSVLARLTGNSGNPEWGPTLAVDSVEAGVRQVLGSLLGDPGLAGQGQVQDAQVDRDGLDREEHECFSFCVTQGVMDGTGSVARDEK